MRSLQPLPTSSLYRRFLLVYLVLHTVTALTFLWIATNWIRRDFVQQSFARLQSVALVIRNHLREDFPTLNESGLGPEIQRLAADLGIRITVIDVAGNVQADSEPQREPLENHGRRPEILAAQRDGVGTAFRRSESVARDLCYLALRVGEGPGDETIGYVRVAGDQDSIFQIQRTLLSYVWLSGLVLAALSALVMARFIQREMEPLAAFSQTARAIAAGRYETVPLALNRQDEWRTLSDAFRQMQTELQNREHSLRENTQRLEAVLSSMIEGVLAIDATGVVILANQAACDILDVEWSQLYSRKLLEVVRVPLLRQALEETQLRRNFSRVVFQTFTEPRKTISAQVCVMANEPIPGVAIVLHDITDIRQLENLRRDFVANVSHELKTPLSSIKAYAETLKMGALRDEEKAGYFLHQIETQADLLNQQIQDLLTLAKVESGQAVFNITSFPVDEICLQVVDAFQETAVQQSLTLEYEPQAQDLTVRADYDELLIILNNLVSNAIRYTPPGGRVRLRSMAEPNRTVFEVSDSGIGIAPEHQARIFERFYRVDKARSREVGGTGLGLSIVKHLTQSMGGSVHVQSTLGQGSTFRIKLPQGT